MHPPLRSPCHPGPSQQPIDMSTELPPSPHESNPYLDRIMYERDIEQVRAAYVHQMHLTGTWREAAQVSDARIPVLQAAVEEERQKSEHHERMRKVTEEENKQLRMEIVRLQKELQQHRYGMTF